MQVSGDPGPDIVHGFTLLKELNSQRGMGHFCDCVIQLHTHPGKVFMAHKSVLAAFSPVLASLLPRHGTLLDLNLPDLTLETLDLLLDYIYTGRIPPTRQRETVLSAAVQLQMGQLLQALRSRLSPNADTVLDKPGHKRRSPQSLDETHLVSPSYYQCGSERPVASSPNYEVVPVICHAKTTGGKALLQRDGHHHCDRSSALNAEHGGDGPDASRYSKELSNHRFPHELDKSSFLEHFLSPSQSKQNKLTDLMSQRSMDVERFGSCSSSGEFRSVVSEDVSQASILCPKGRCRRPTSETECGQSFSRCTSGGDGRHISDVDGIQAFISFESGKGDHLEELLSDSFNNKNPYNASGSAVENSSHHCGQFCPEDSPESQDNLSLENSSSTVPGERTSRSDAWQEIGQPYDEKSLFEGRPLEMASAEKDAVKEKPQTNDCVEGCGFPKPRTDCVGKYQGQLQYHYLFEQSHPTTDSSDSDSSDRPCPGPNIEARKSTTDLVTIDITEIALSRRRSLQDSRDRTLTLPIQCSLCDRVFNHRGSLNRHMRSHLGVRPYSCPQCPMTFSRQYRVAEHMRIHQRTSEGQTEGGTTIMATAMDT